METRHSDNKNKNKSFLERKLEILSKTRSIFVKKYRTENENLTEASYRAPYHISLHGETHIIGEFLVRPTLKDVVSSIFDEKSAEAVESISLSDNTMSCRIDDIAENIENELISLLYACDAYVLQMNESTDVDGLAILFVFDRYNLKNVNNLLFCKSLILHTTGKYIFHCIDNYVAKHGIDWIKCISVCTDGAKVMTGKLSGVVTRIKNATKSCISNHCILHRYALVTK